MRIDPLVHSVRWIDRAKVALLYFDGTEGHSLDSNYCACEWQGPGNTWQNPNDARLSSPNAYQNRRTSHEDSA